MTGWQQTINAHRNATSDYLKMEPIFNTHLSTSMSIKNEVKEWMNEKWNEWETEKPEWFTNELIKSIPDDYIPGDAVRRMDDAAANGKRERRRSISITEGVREL